MEHELPICIAELKSRKRFIRAADRDKFSVFLLGKAGLKKP